MRTDVLVVGGGPAGAATAYHLARRGVDVLLVDRATFPREKVCGDGLAPRGVRALLEMGVDPAADGGFTRVEGLRVHGAGTPLDLPWPDVPGFPAYGLVRTRHDLDHLLLGTAESAGARVWEGTEAAGPVRDRGWVVGARLRRDGSEEVVRASFVVACDGAASRFAAGAGVRRDPGRPLGIAARRYFRVEGHPTRHFESWLQLWDGGRLLPGYGWIFPLGDGLVNVGAGLLNTYTRFRDVTARRVYELFLSQVGPERGLTEDNAVGPILSGPLPMGMNRRPLAVPGLLVAGDAGGIVNPFNGEGIAYALESGQLAAELLHEALVRDRPAVAHLYPLLLRQRYGRYFSLGRAFVSLIGHPGVMRLATRYGLPREGLMRFLLRVMANVGDGRAEDLDGRLFGAMLRVAPEG